MMLVGRDKMVQEGPARPGHRSISEGQDSTRIIFVRHGESAWNLIFNVGPKILVPFKAVHALLRETLPPLRLDDD